MSGIGVSDTMDLVIKTSPLMLIYIYFLDNYKIKIFKDYSVSMQWKFFHHTEEQLLYINFNALILHPLHSSFITNNY